MGTFPPRPGRICLDKTAPVWYNHRDKGIPPRRGQFATILSVNKTMEQRFLRQTLSDEAKWAIAPIFCCRSLPSPG